MVIKVLEVIKAIILGIIQGISEVLPISSSAHNAVVYKIFYNNSISLTNEIFLHLSSTIACIIFLVKDIKIFFKSLISKKFDYFFKLILGTLPAFILYLILGDYLDMVLDNIMLIGVFLIFTSFILLISSTLFNNNSNKNISFKSSFMIGLCQSLALIPGISRSGMTLFGGLTNKINLKEIIKFSMFLYLISSLGSIILDFKNISNFNLNLYSIISFTTSLIFTYLSLYFLYNKFKKRHFVFFSIYTFIFGFILVIIHL